MLQIGRDGPPMLAVAGAGRRHAVDRLDALGIEEVPRHAQALAEIDRPDEEQIDAVDGGNRVTLLDGPQRLDLDCDERLAIRLLAELRGRDAAEIGVETAVVQTRARAA